MADGTEIGNARLGKLIADFEKDVPALREQAEELEALRRQFVEDYSVERIKEMQIDDYVIGKTGLGGPESFCYRIERKLDGLGSIRGGTSEKFGLYYNLKDQDYRIAAKRFGSDVDEAFETIKAGLISLIEAGGKGDFEAIRASVFAPVFRAKILSTYYPNKYLSVFEEEHMQRFAGGLGIGYSESDDQLDLQGKIVDWFHSQPAMAGYDLNLLEKFLYSSFDGSREELAKGRKPSPQGPGGILDSVRKRLSVVLYGPPGTGKTYWTTRLALAAAGIDADGSREDQKRAYDELVEEGRVQFVTFHQSYSYEDFVQGLFPARESGGGLVYHVKPGAFKTLCDRAASDPENEYVFIIDELNRGNVSAIFGELITLLEEDKRLGGADERTVKLMHVDETTETDEWGVPGNVHVIATMNTADRSLTQLDAAVRRRFSFVEMPPDYGALAQRMAQLKEASAGFPQVDVPLMLEKMNDRICALYDRDHQIGHSFFWGVDSLDALRDVFAEEVIPLLNDYFFEDCGLVRAVLNDESGVFVKVEQPDQASLGIGWADVDRELNPKATVADRGSWTAADFAAIYGGKAAASAEGADGGAA